MIGRINIMEGQMIFEKLFKTRDVNNLHYYLDKENIPTKTRERTLAFLNKLLSIPFQNESESQILFLYIMDFLFSDGRELIHNNQGLRLSIKSNLIGYAKRSHDSNLFKITGLSECPFRKWLREYFINYEEEMSDNEIEVLIFS